MSELSFRQLHTKPLSINEDERSVEVVVSTEEPVSMPDFRRGTMVQEVLLNSGADVPRQLVLLDTHQRRSVASVLGSVRGLHSEGNKIIGRAHFASDDDSQKAFQKIRDGHVTDLSVGYIVSQSEFVRDGDNRTIAGRSFAGPVSVVTSWSAKEVSVLPIGADPRSKIRCEHFQFDESGDCEDMKPELRTKCVEAGMPDNFDDDQAQTWLAERVGSPATSKPDIELQRREEIESLTSRHGCEGLAQGYIERGLTIEAAGAELLEHIASTRVKMPISRTDAGPAQADKHSAAIQGALLTRAYRTIGASPKIVDELSPGMAKTPGLTDLRHANLIDLARECLEMDGVRTRGLSREQIAQAVFDPGVLRQRASAPYHTTASFPGLTANVFSKSLLAAYVESPVSWRFVFRQAPSVPDFKDINRVKLGEIPSLDQWNDTEDPNEVSMADERTPYAVEAFSNKISFGYKLLLNDDMDALSRAPALFGRAAARTNNEVAWAQVTANPTLTDGQALFLNAAAGNRQEANEASSGAAISSATLGTGLAALRTMHGLNSPENAQSNSILNLIPKSLVVPAALEVTANEQTNSIFSPNTSVNEQTVNVFGPRGSAPLAVIVEPLLDADSTGQWYLFVDPAQLPVVEMSFLDGQETPQVRNWVEQSNLSQNFACLQSFAAKALDYRGAWRNPGA